MSPTIDRPNRPIPAETARKAQERHVVDAETGCWISTFAVNKSTGYTTVSWRVDGHAYGTTSHRASWTHTNGQIPDGLVIDHTCHVRPCVNPDHLRAITLMQNNIRRNNSGAHEFSLDTCQRGHPLSMMKMQQGGKNAGRWRRCQGCQDENNASLTLIRKQLRLLEITYGMSNWHTKGAAYFRTLDERNARMAAVRAELMEEAA